MKIKFKNKCQRIFAMFLTVFVLASVIISSFGIETLAAGIDALSTTASGGTVITSIALKVTPQNAKTTDVFFTNSEVRAYPKNGQDTFRVSLVINGQDYAGKNLPSGVVLPSDVTFNYRTYDLSAIATSGDYTAISGTHTFTAGSNEGYYDFNVVVNSTSYGLYHNRDLTATTYRQIDWAKSTDELYTTEVYGHQAPADTAYNARSFGFEIYDITGADVYHTANSSTGKNVYYDTAIGTLPVAHYLPYSWTKSDGKETWQLYWYGAESVITTSSTASMPRDGVDTVKTYINTQLATRFNSDVVNTGLGHYYFSGRGYHYGPDVSQRDSYAGLTYEGYQNATSINDKTLMKDWGMGVVMYEMDGYPSGECIDFACYREKSSYGSDYDEVEWSEHTYQFEKYRTIVSDRDPEDNVYAYKIEGTPSWIGMTGKREKYGEDRKIKNISFRLYFRDDSPVQIVSTYIEDTKTFEKTSDDSLRIMIRFNEPVQVNNSNLPELICGMNNTTVTSAASTSKNILHFKYEYGNGTDTLVFKMELKDLPSTDVLKQVQIYYMKNADKVSDFSSRDEIHITGKTSNSKTVYKAISITSDTVTKAAGEQWTVAKTYAGATDKWTDPVLIGPLTLTLTANIDPREPVISDIKDDNSGKTVKNHTVQITLNTSGLDVAVYAHWTENLNGAIDTEIPRPTSYSENERLAATTSSGKYYNASAALEGTVYLWVKAETAFGKVDERLCGPFFFDKSAETVTDIHLTGGGSLTSQSKEKTIEFTVDHTGDYLSYSGNKTFVEGTNSETEWKTSNIQLSELSLVYSDVSVWGTNSGIVTKTLYDGKSNSRNLTAIVSGTKEDYVYKFKFSDKNLATSTTTQTVDQFIVKDNSGASVKAKYITKVTYKITIGYSENNFNDFNLSADEAPYKRVYIGFQTKDASGNTKEATSAAFTAGKDYISDVYAFFDLRDIKEASVTYPQKDNPAYNVLLTDSGNIDESVNAFAAGQPVTVNFSFTDNTRILLKDLLLSGYEVKVHISKPNSAITHDDVSADNTQGHNLLTWGDQVMTKVSVKDGETTKLVDAYKAGAFVSNAAVLLDGSNDPVTQYTSWFTWILTGKEGSGDATSFNGISITTNTVDAVSDLYGYYEIYFSFQNGSEVKYTPSATFYLGNNENKTANVQTINDGKVFINKVFQLPTSSRYYYQTSDGSVCDPYYATLPATRSEAATAQDPDANRTPTALTFSDESIARKYLLYREYQDLYLYQIPIQEVADSLNQTNGGRRSAYDVNTGRYAEPGQWWIRYKVNTWAPGNKNKTAWIYYYFCGNTGAPTLDVDNLRDDLNKAINDVVDTILATGSTVVLTGEENLTKYGTPYIPVTAVRYEPESVEKTNCGSLYARSVAYQGDSHIYSASVLISESVPQTDKYGNPEVDKYGETVYENVTMEYQLASTTLVTVQGLAKLYISPYDGPYAGVWGEVPAGENILLKETINTVYRQILKKAGIAEVDQGNVTAPSGRYAVLEVDENGFASVNVYLDCDAPQINFAYTVYNEQGKTVSASKYYTSGKEGGLVIHGVSFTLKGIGEFGRDESTPRNPEIDDYAYVVVYNRSKRLLYAMTVEDLKLENPVLRDEGTYSIEVWDRSGNSYSFSVELAAMPMVVTAKPESEGVNVKVEYREADQILIYEVKRNGITIDTTFAKSKTYSENGLYSVRVVDRFGVEFKTEEDIKYTREIPPVAWRVAGNNDYVGDGVNDQAGYQYTDYAKLVAVDSVTYNVVTSVPLAFSYSTAAGIKVEMLDDTDLSYFNINPSQKTTYTQEDLFNFSVKCSYVSHPNVYVVYNVVVDTVPPIIDVEYDHYSFESRTDLDAMLRFLELNGDYTVGQVITPRRIDYSLLSTTTLRVSSGASVYTSEARMTLRDNSGISKFKVELDGKVLYEGEYRSDGKYLLADGSEYNFNTFTEYGKYTITAYDALANRSVFTFTNTPSNDIVYSVDGKTYEPYYDYVYETDATGRVIHDENGDPIVKEKWLFLQKFEEDTEQTIDPKYLDRSTKYTAGNYFRRDREFTYAQYGNTSQKIVLSRDSDVQILLTYEDDIRVQVEGEEMLKTVTCYRFIGLRIENDGIYLYQYVVDVDGGNISVAADVAKTPVVTLQEAKTGNESVVYYFDDYSEVGNAKLGMYLTAVFNKDDTVTLTLNAPTDPSKVVTSEMKVSQLTGAFEPSFFKTVLSLYQSSVEVDNEHGKIEIDEEEMESGQWKYTNGDKIFVNTETAADPYLTDVMISYSKTMTPGTYHYLYSVDPDANTLPYYSAGDGYYFIKTVNLFGNEKIYKLAISNSLLVSTVADYVDGWTRQFATEEVVGVSANKTVTVSFRDDENITYTVTKGGELFEPECEIKSGAVTLVFSESGDYEIVVSDRFGNRVERHISIETHALKLPSNIILNPQTNALRYSENYTNKQVSVNSALLSQYDISYIAIEKDGTPTTVLLDLLSASDERKTATAGSFSKCIGLAGDGDYRIVFRDSHGNRANVTVHYRETPTLSLSRMTKLSEQEEPFSLEDAQNPDINFISNNTLQFYTDAEMYVFKIDGVKSACPKKIGFANNETTGRVAYEIDYQDEYGFVYHFTAVLYRAEISLELDPSVSAIEVGGVLMTSDNIRVLCSAGATCYYQQEGGEYCEFPAGTVLKKDGTYSIYAEDIAGNYNAFTVTKDSVVSYSFREGRYGKKIEKGFVTNSDNLLFQPENGDSAVIKAAYLNGVKVDGSNGYSFTKNGKWEVVVADDTGNESLFSFYVYTHEINRFDFNEPMDYTITDVWYTALGTGKVSVNSSIQTDDETGLRHILFDRAGTYSVVMYSNYGGTPVNFSIEISEDAPTATLVGVENGGATIDTISISNTQKDDVVYVYKNGASTPTKVYEISYDGEKIEISDEGEYTVVVKNRAENEVTFNFTRKHVANTAGSALIILLLAGIVVGLFAGMTYRNKSKVDK